MKLPPRLQEQQRIREEALRFKCLPSPKPITAVSSDRPARKPQATARELGQSLPKGFREIPCQECGGSGFDPGSVDPFGELCTRCKGAKLEVIERDYLAEAFRICSEPDPQFRVEREHVVAIVEHCRAFVSAAIALPKVAA